MAALGEILRRFRFHGVPGAPAAFGVPTDHAAEFDSELRAVFAALHDDQRKAAALLAQADVKVTQIRSSGTEQARQVIATSRPAATSAREAVATRIRDETSRECAATLAAAHAEAGRVEQVAAERLPPLVAEVVRTVLAIGATR